MGNTGRRATPAEFEFRVDFIYQRAIQGYRSPSSIHDLIAKIDAMTPKERAKSKNEDIRNWKPWKVSKTQLDVYRRAAGNRFIEAAKGSQEENLGAAKEQLDDLYRRTLANEEHGNALRARRQKSEMEGLVDLTIKGGLTLSLDTESLGARLREKVEKARAHDENNAKRRAVAKAKRDKEQEG